MKMRDAYLGDKPDRQEALEFLCLAEAAEVIHYEVLRSLSKKFKTKNFGKKIKRILEEEKKHLKFCTKLVKENIVEQK
jgi:rubrerythrin